MNRKILSIFFLASIVMLFSCADDDLSPILTFDKAGKGAYAKLLNESAQELDLANLSAAQYSYCVEFVDIDAGNTVSQYDINVTYEDNNPGNGDNSAGPINLRSIGSGEFNSTDRIFRGSCVEITLTELLSAFGLSSDDLVANDQFRFNTTVTTNEGATFGSANSDSDVNGSAFGGHFDYTLKATCPLNETIFTGDYTMTYLDLGNQAFGVEPYGADGRTVTLRTNPPSTTQRAFAITYLEAGGFGQGTSDYIIDFVCTDVVTVIMDGGLGCGGGNIMVAAGETIPIDITNDAEITISGTEWRPDGGCGVPEQEVRIQLTKQ